MRRGSEILQLLKSLLNPTILILIWMSVCRYTLYDSLFSAQFSNSPYLKAAFVAGYRFDLCVLGFFWIPPLILSCVLGLLIDPKKLFVLWKVYFMAIVGAVFYFSWMDFFWTAVKGTRLNSQFFESDAMAVLQAGWQAVGSNQSWIATGIMGIPAVLLLVMLFRKTLGPVRMVPTKLGMAFQFLAFFFFVTFAARGTWTPHHLNIEHTRISPSGQLNQLPLNALWNLDK